ncbi:hypothetical protein WJX75_009011 [Coccomyxa subellipsoidea]|uniref:Uncharacterized protein n=1 Tax=Coccomyxa subellipsoidea TaxID=248742 RepID=A0ABR2Z0W9_9CHLO
MLQRSPKYTSTTSSQGCDVRHLVWTDCGATMRRAHGRSVADGWAKPEQGQTCLDCREDWLCFLEKLSPESDDPSEISQRLTVELSKNLPIKRGFFSRSVNMLATSEFTISACVHGEGPLRSICIKVSSVQSTVACQVESINKTLFLSSSSLEVRAANGSTSLELRIALDERHPTNKLRILRDGKARFDIPARDGFTWSVHPKVCVELTPSVL